MDQVADSVFEKNGGPQVDRLRFRAETSLDLRDFARWRPRPKTRPREAFKAIDVTRRSNDLLLMTQLEKTPVQRKSYPEDPRQHAVGGGLHFICFPPLTSQKETIRRLLDGAASRIADAKVKAISAETRLPSACTVIRSRMWATGYKLM